MSDAQRGAARGGRLELWMFALQRLSAMILAPLVLVHLATMIYAAQGGLSAAEILGRTQGSVVWAVVYSLFVIAASVHGAIGLRTILREMTPLGGARASIVGLLFFGMVLSLGLRAVGIVT